MDALDDHLQTKRNENFDFIRIDGNTRSEIRHDLVSHFQETEACKVALLSITAACLGITLTAASTVIFAEVHWTPALMFQAEDRAHRIG
jgi:SWI/SNF-related matrix-associated actin-dependent regulator 1 of chromatin subfamily A